MVNQCYVLLGFFNCLYYSGNFHCVGKSDV
nr:MAG TPA: hypothetical protein [Caudoviricetes sp.]